jgi:hypothetical protein
MTKQLLIYTDAQAVSSSKHRNLSVKTGRSYGFASDTNSVPLTAVEFMSAAAEYPIVFAGEDDQLMPLVVMGVRDKENLFINSEGEFEATYIPAFLRRYPFVFSSQDGGDNLTLCIDQTFSGCNNDNIGERLFDSEAEQTQYLKGILEFMKEYQVHFARTQIFSKTLKELDLLQPMGAQFTASSGEKLSLTGFYAIDRKKLKELPAEDLEKLVKNDGMELIYLHLHSLRNFNTMLSKINADQVVDKVSEEAEIA